MLFGSVTSEPFTGHAWVIAAPSGHLPTIRSDFRKREKLTVF